MKVVFFSYAKVQIDRRFPFLACQLIKIILFLLAVRPGIEYIELVSTELSWVK